MKQILITGIFVIGLSGLSLGQNTLNGVAKTQPDAGEATLVPGTSTSNPNSSATARSNQNVTTYSSVRKERASSVQPTLGQGTSNNNNNSSTSRTSTVVTKSGVARTEKEVGTPSIQPASITPNSPK